MTTAPDGFRRWTLGTRRIGRRQRMAALLIAAIGAAVILALLRADVRGPVGTIVLLVVVPVVLIGAVALTVHALHCRRANRRNLAGPQPVGPPIQHVAAELRRLLWQHDRMVGYRDGTAMSKRLWALETAITHRATQAARALGVPFPQPPADLGLDRAELRRLLRTLAAEGLVLPATVGLMTPDSR